VSGASIVIDRVARVTPLGLRFVDEATGRVVAVPLRVTAGTPADPARSVEAFPNRVGTFVVPRLPGPRDPDIEFGDGSADYWASVAPRPSVIEVRDPSGQFIPFRVEAPLPVRGLAVPPCLPAASPPVERIPLFSAPSRPVPPGYGVIRAEVRARFVEADGSVRLAPAAFALLVATVAGAPARGLADREGCVAILTPFPEPVPGVAAGSPPSSGPGLWQQEWPVELEAFYHPHARVPEVADLCRALAQPPVPLWEDEDATRPVPQLTLQYGRELVAPALVVSPSGPPS
jgi:hypothetical protein